MVRTRIGSLLWSLAVPVGLAGAAVAPNAPEERDIVFPCRTLVRNADTGRPLTGALAACTALDSPATALPSGDDGIVAFLGLAGTETVSQGPDFPPESLAEGADHELGTVGKVVTGLLMAVGGIDVWNLHTRRPFREYDPRMGAGPTPPATAQRVSGCINARASARITCEAHQPFEGPIPVWYAVGPWRAVRPGPKAAGSALRGKGGCYLGEVHLAREGTAGQSRASDTRITVTQASVSVEARQSGTRAHAEAELRFPEVFARAWDGKRLPFAVIAHSGAFAQGRASDVTETCGLAIERSVPLRKLVRRTPETAVLRGTVGLNPSCPAGEHAVCVHLVSLVAGYAPVPSVFVSSPATLAYRRVDSALYPRTHHVATQVTYPCVAHCTTPGPAPEAAPGAGQQAEP